MDMKSRVFCWWCVYLFLVLLWGTATGSGITRRNLEVMKHLNRLNKPAFKSIESPDGDVIDCVLISQQPAFDHPFLKTHTIQMRPNYSPEGIFSETKKVGSSEEIIQMWHMNGRCPEGTIPIRRNREEDVLRASSVKRYGKKKHRSIPRPRPAAPEPDLINQNGHQHAIAYVEGDRYYGAKATINVWDPSIQQTNEFSLSQLWILGGSFASDLNSIEAGWQVSPDLYGDNNTRLFTYWTSDAYQATGCYNLLCSGFIQINSEIAMGASIFPTSNYMNNQYDISILVWKDPKEGNWWMQFGNGYVLGYWPAFLFSYLSDSASMIEWGGEVVNSASDGQHTTTQMGSGHFPEEGFGKSSYFRNIQIVDESNNLRTPKDVGIFTEQSGCYDIQLGKNGEWGSYFYYGGPGRNTHCP
ncbi:protein neprosin-like [Henckelia pumila]|uniref:protein neprosin-like n=1 Tax=Henckelia pumila TaxID=405737 RepID=UPI003C6DFE5A